MRKAMLLLALAALMAPATAAAASIELDGKAVTLAGRGFVRGELTAAADSRPVLIRAKAGYVKVVDLGDDLKVRCGNGKSATRRNDEGQTVFLCAGRGGPMAISGSHFKLNGFAMRLAIRIPDGYTGKLGGNLHEAAAGDRDGADGRPARDAERDSRRRTGRPARSRSASGRLAAVPQAGA